jgi:uncharacterized GH25 family protein
VGYGSYDGVVDGRMRRDGQWRGRLLVVAVLAAVTAVPGRAHDFWIEPDTFRPAPEHALQVSLRVGDTFGRGEPLPRDLAHARRFTVAGPDGERTIPGRHGRTPAGRVRLSTAGTYVLAYGSRPRTVQLDAERFEAYLHDEGLERIVAIRADTGESLEPGREAFSRCAKAIVHVGAPGAPGWDRPAGLSLELMPARDPSTLTPGDVLTVRLLDEGRPLAGARVSAVPAADPNARVQATTAGDGGAGLRLDRPGVWLVKSVHMRRAAAGVDVDWESRWASLTFEVPAAPAHAP